MKPIYRVIFREDKSHWLAILFYPINLEARIEFQSKEFKKCTSLPYSYAHYIFLKNG